MDKCIKKSKILLEAMPYIQEFAGEVFVIKYGGSALGNPKEVERVLRDIVFLNLVGMRPILVHGGGPLISKRMKALKRKIEFVAGKRKTDKQAAKIVDSVLSKVNAGLAKKIKAHGAAAKGLLGRDKGLIRAKQISKALGFAGKPVGVNTKLIKKELASGVIPVISPVGRGADGMLYNVNADEVASAIAKAMKAQKLVLLTDVKGIMNKRGKLVSTLNVKSARHFIKAGVIDGGMVPKVNACMSAIRAGVKKAHVISAHLQHSLLLEIFTNKGIGTEIVK